MSTDQDKARRHINRPRPEKGGLICPKCGQGGAAVYAHLIHCSDLTTEEKIQAMTGHYGLDEQGARETVEAWERPAQVQQFSPRDTERAPRP
jgi:hypothetical protein